MKKLIKLTTAAVLIASCSYSFAQSCPDPIEEGLNLVETGLGIFNSGQDGDVFGTIAGAYNFYGAFSSFFSGEDQCKPTISDVMDQLDDMNGKLDEMNMKIDKLEVVLDEFKLAYDRKELQKGITRIHESENYIETGYRGYRNRLHDLGIQKVEKMLKAPYSLAVREQLKSLSDYFNDTASIYHNIQVELTSLLEMTNVNVLLDALKEPFVTQFEQSAGKDMSTIFEQYNQVVAATYVHSLEVLQEVQEMERIVVLLNDKIAKVNQEITQYNHQLYDDFIGQAFDLNYADGVPSDAQIKHDFEAQNQKMLENIDQLSPEAQAQLREKIAERTHEFNTAYAAYKGSLEAKIDLIADFGEFGNTTKGRLAAIEQKFKTNTETLKEAFQPNFIGTKEFRIELKSNTQRAMYYNARYNPKNPNINHIIQDNEAVVGGTRDNNGHNWLLTYNDKTKAYHWRTDNPDPEMVEKSNWNDIPTALKFEYRFAIPYATGGQGQCVVVSGDKLSQITSTDNFWKQNGINFIETKADPVSIIMRRNEAIIGSDVSLPPTGYYSPGFTPANYDPQAQCYKVISNTVVAQRVTYLHGQPGS